ncbi:MAG: FmdB family zinc ribbon protein [Chlamydiales bacterium]
MPTYDYTCSACGYQMEASQKITEKPLLTCPRCDKEALRRGVGGGSALFRFKGSGFYITDYPKDGVEKGSCENCSCSKE